MDETTTAILDSDLPSALQVTLLHLYRQAEGDLFLGTHEDVSEARGVSRGTVSSQIRDLKARGWLEDAGRALRVRSEAQTSDTGGSSSRDGYSASENGDTTSEDGDSVSEDGGMGKGFPLGSLRFSPKKTYSNPFSPSLLTPSQTSLEPPSAPPPPWLRPSDRWESVSEPLPDDHPARWEYSPDDWRWIAADWALQRLEADEMLNSHYRKRLNGERRGKIASEWADEIRKLVELDGYSRDDVRITLGWLLGTDNWWRRNRTIQSLKALRKKGDDGTTKFDKILQSALADYEQKQQQQADPESIRDGFSDDEREADSSSAGGDSLPGEPEVDAGGFVW